MSLPITRNTTASYGEQIKQNERLRPVAAGALIVILVLMLGRGAVVLLEG